MKKSKFYVLISLLIVVLLFSVSALCNQCGIITPATTDTTAETATEKTDVGESKESASDETTDQTEETTDQTEETSATDQSSGNEAPAIKLEIYEGPTYSAGDDICFYRVKAVVTGKPAPTVKFSRDDSGGVWGTKKAQVNIHRGETYKLTATAKNSEGEATASKTLTWGCNSNPVINSITLSSATIEINKIYNVTANATDPDGDTLTYKWTTSGGTINDDSTNPMKWTTPGSAGSYTITLKVTDGKGGEATQSKDVSVETAVVNLDVPKVNTEGGYIEQGGKINTGGGLFAGDSAAGSGYIGNRAVRGYISFDITGLNGKTIDQATLTFNINSIYGVPPATFGGMWVGVVDWGAEALVLSDFDLPQVGIQLFNMTGGGNITCTTATLKTQLQSAINGGKSRFQIMISHPGMPSSFNNTWDGWSYLQAGVNLNINYH
ncbi:MAG: PKD domain-containing protein [Actinomycetia bacterium]|nr:PKD domain-containing protein [Actinomycetes bacterium]